MGRISSTHTIGASLIVCRSRRPSSKTPDFAARAEAKCRQQAKSSPRNFGYDCALFRVMEQPTFLTGISPDGLDFRPFSRIELLSSANHTSSQFISAAGLKLPIAL
jgi:hypothetical protein